MRPTRPHDFRGVQDFGRRVFRTEASHEAHFGSSLFRTPPDPNWERLGLTMPEKSLNKGGATLVSLSTIAAERR